MIMAQSLFIYLKELFPEASIDVLAPGWSCALLQRMPQVREAITLPFQHGQFKPLARYQLGKSLRDKHYDWCINLSYTWKSALVPFGANIKQRSGFVGEQRWGLLNDIYKLDKQAIPLMVQRYVYHAQPQGENALELAKIPKPRLQVDKQQQQTLLSTHGLDPDKPIIAFCPGAEYGPAKRWPLDYFALVGQQLIAMGYQIILMGSAKDAGLTVPIAAKLPTHCTDLSGKTSLQEAIDLLAACKAVLSNDSGLMHIAAAVDCYIFALYGSSTPQYTPPLTDRVSILYKAISCSPCFKRTCRFGHYQCLTELTPEYVMSQMKQQLSS